MQYIYTYMYIDRIECNIGMTVMLANIAQGDRLTKGRSYYNGYIKVNAYFGAYKDVY